MRRPLLLKTSAVVSLCLCLAAPATANVKLPGVFGDHMVLQRDQAVPVWGWGESGEKVTVTFGQQTQTATTGGNGRWSVKLDPVKAGGPYVLTVAGKNTLHFSDVLVGEVWLCSGQSNMEMQVNGVLNPHAESVTADYPKLRMITVKRNSADAPQQTSTGEWVVCSPKTVTGFSATAYFFGRELHKRLDVPVGLVHSSWGGTQIQAWTSMQAQQAVPGLASVIDAPKNAAMHFNAAAAKEQFEKAKAAWDKEAAAAKTQGKPFTKPQPRMATDPMTAPGNPARLYNGMIAPLVPYAIRGAIWYQGESNAGVAKLYGLQLRTMIANWRQDWHQGDFPFLYVQLPNYMAAQKQPSETGGWPIVREEMLKTLSLPNTGMAVTIDVGETGNIHPKNKEAVGYRLAQWALAKTYDKKKVVACGPLYTSIDKQDGKVVVHFDCAKGGLVAKGGKLKGFAVAGDDKKFVWADAKIDGETVVVSSAEVKQPTAVRYAWANNPECNLTNKAGLPASPFRSDDWAD